MRSKYLSIIAALFAVTFASCDFLEKEPSDRLANDEFYQSESDLAALTGGLYNTTWFDFNKHFYHAIGDGLSNNLWGPYDSYLAPVNTLSEISSSGAVDEGWNSFYQTVNQCNTIVKNISDPDLCSSNITESTKKKYIAEARFMRGLAYWYLASCWGDVPIIEDNAKMILSPLAQKVKQEEVFLYALTDMEYAACYLPKTQANSGRVTRYSALGMLSRMYLVYSGFIESKNQKDNTYTQGQRDETYLRYAWQAADYVIGNSGLSLETNYKDLFLTSNNNNQESLFALQWVNGVYDGATSNTHQSWLGYSTGIVAGQVAEGSDIYASADMITSYESNDIRRHSTWFTYRDYYEEINKVNGGLTYDRTTEVNEMPDRCNVKKGIVGTYEDNGVSYENNSGLNTYMLRLAEVYLNFCDAAMGNNEVVNKAIKPNACYNDPITVLNKIYSRARSGATITSMSKTNLLRERRLEFALEGRYWFDLLAWSYYDRSNVINYILGDQKRTYEYTYNTTNNIYSTSGSTIGVVGVTAENFSFLLPYPSSEVTQDPYLSGDAISYSGLDALKKEDKAYRAALQTAYNEYLTDNGITTEYNE